MISNLGLARLSVPTPLQSESTTNETDRTFQNFLRWGYLFWFFGSKFRTFGHLAWLGCRNLFEFELAAHDAKQLSRIRSVRRTKFQKCSNCWNDPLRRRRTCSSLQGWQARKVFQTFVQAWRNQILRRLRRISMLILKLFFRRESAIIY